MENGKTRGGRLRPPLGLISPGAESPRVSSFFNDLRVLFSGRWWERVWRGLLVPGFGRPQLRLGLGLALGLLLSPSPAKAVFDGTYTGAPFNFCLPSADSYGWDECWDFNWTVINSSFSTIFTSTGALQARILALETWESTAAPKITASELWQSSITPRIAAHDAWMSTASVALESLRVTTETFRLWQSTASPRITAHDAFLSTAGAQFESVAAATTTAKTALDTKLSSPTVQTAWSCGDGTTICRLNFNQYGLATFVSSNTVSAGESNTYASTKTFTAGVYISSPTGTHALIFDGSIVGGPHIGVRTADGADNSSMTIVAGGYSASHQTRGASIILQGNEAPNNAGNLIVSAGNVSGASVSFRTGGSERMVITNAGNVEAGGQVAISTSLGGNGNIRIGAGTGTGGGPTPIVLYESVLSSSTVNTGAGTIMAGVYVMPANTIANVGDTLEVVCKSTNTTATQNKTLKIYLDTDDIPIPAQSVADAYFVTTGLITYQGSNNFHGWAKRERQSAFYAETDESLAGDITTDLAIYCSLLSVNAAPQSPVDMNLNYMRVILYPAP